MFSGTGGSVDLVITMRKGIMTHLTLIIEETFHSKVLNVLHMAIDVKGKKSLSNRSDTENIHTFKFLYAVRRSGFKL